jgi:hypothetical protein
VGIQTQLQITGLETLPSELGEGGSLTQADNIVIDRENVAEPRRGFELYNGAFGSAGDRSKQLFTYKDRVLNHYQNKLQYDSGTGAFISFDGNYSEPDPTQRMRSIDANSNFYFTTSDGVKKISATGADQFSSSSGFVVNAGGPKALDLEASLVNQPGFFTYDSKVAYRILWGTRDANTNLILGAPSERVVISNSLSESLVKDFNDLLLNIDSAAAASSSDIFNDTNYFLTLSLPSDATAADLRVNLLTLAEKLDKDFTITEPSITTASGSRIGQTVDLVFSAAVSGRLVAGDKISVAGFVTPLDPLNSTTANQFYTVSEVTSTSVSGDSIKYTTATSGTIANTASIAGVVELYNFRSIEQPEELSDSPTFDQLDSLRNYYDNLVLELQNLNTPLGRIAPPGYFDDNLSDDSAQVKLSFSIPRELNSGNISSYFYQIYRTEVRQGTGPITLSDIDPGDEMGLVYENNATSAQLAEGYVEIIDETPDTFRGVNLYTNPNTGEGILQANEPPPVAKDLARFKGSTFYANTRTKHKKTITLLGTTNLTDTIETSLSQVSVSSNIASLIFSSSVTGLLSASSTIALSEFTGAALPVNGVHTLTSVSGVTAQFSLTASNFSTSASADFGDIVECGKLYIKSGLVTNTYTFVPSAQEQTKIEYLPASSLTSTGSADYFTINAGNGNGYYVWYSVSGGTNTDPAPTGLTGIEVVVNPADSASAVAASTNLELFSTFDFAATGTFYNSATGYVQSASEGFTGDVQDFGTGFTFTVLTQGTGDNLSLKYVGVSNAATPAQRVDDTARSLIKNINRNTSSLVNAYYLSGVADAPGKINLETVTLGTTAFYLNSSKLSVGESFDPTIPTSGTTVISDNEVSPNALYYSKTDQPEAVPIVNRLFLGSRDKAIKRILALRDSLFVLKEDGVFRVSGEGPSTFSQFLFDGTAKILSPDSAAVLNNQIYVWTNQGISRIGEAGVDTASRVIENTINGITIIPGYEQKSFGVAYELDRAYLLWTISKSADTTATQCYRYNFFTNTWTRWPIAKSSGIVTEFDNKLYVGAGDTNRVEQERKSFSRTDYSDRSYILQLPFNSVLNNVISLPTIENIQVHDVIAQKQYLTIVEFNRLLKTIDLDSAIVTALDNNYFSTLAASSGVDMAAAVQAVAAKLDVDLGTSFASIPAIISMVNTNPLSLQVGYNALVNAMNASFELSFGNYPLVNDTTMYESLVLSVDSNQRKVTVEYNTPFITGELTLYKHYSAELAWDPHYMGDPSQGKHIREAKLIFETTAFRDARVAYATDILPSFQEIEFMGSGGGTFGNSDYGDIYFGGGGYSAPIRTYIPQQKQRCRFIRCRFGHDNAREKFSLYGMVLVGESFAVQDRAYR